MSKKLFIIVLIHTIVTQPTWTMHKRSENSSSFSLLSLNASSPQQIKNKPNVFNANGPSAPIDLSSEALSLSGVSPIRSLGSSSSQKGISRNRFFSSDHSGENRGNELATSIYELNSSNPDVASVAVQTEPKPTTQDASTAPELKESNTQDTQTDALIWPEDQNRGLPAEKPLGTDQETQSKSTESKHQEIQTEPTKPKTQDASTQSAPENVPQNTQELPANSTQPLLTQALLTQANPERTSMVQPPTQTFSSTHQITPVPAEKPETKDQETQSEPQVLNSKAVQWVSAKQSSVQSIFMEYFNKIWHLIQTQVRKIRTTHRDEHDMNETTKNTRSKRPLAQKTSTNKASPNKAIMPKKQAPKIIIKKAGHRSPRENPFHSMLIGSKKMIASFFTKFTGQYKPMVYSAKKTLYTSLCKVWDDTVNFVKTSTDHMVKVLTNRGKNPSQHHDDVYRKPLAYVNLSSRRPEPYEWSSSKNMFAPLSAFNTHSKTLGGARKIQLATNVVSYADDLKDSPVIKTARRFDKDMFITV